MKYAHNQIEPLETRIAPANAMFFTAFSDDLKAKLDAVQDIVDAAVDVGSLIPVVGDKIVNAGKVIDNFSDDLRGVIAQLAGFTDPQIQTAIFDLLGPGAMPELRLLGDTNNSGGVTEADVIITHPESGRGGESILIDISLHATASVGTDVAFDVGLASLPIKVEGNAGVKVAATLDYQHLKFGYSEATGFIFDTSAENELSVAFTAGLSEDFHVTATIGFLHGEIRDGSSKDSDLHSQLSAQLIVDITDTAPFYGKVDFDATADVALQLDAGFDENFPGIGADFLMHFGGLKPEDPAPTVEFTNVHVNLGSAISGILQPILEHILPLLQPIQPIVDFVTEPIPVVSDLGAGDVTLLGIAGVAAKYAPPHYQQLFQLASTIIEVLNFVNDFKADPNTKDISIDFGSFLAVAEADPSADLRDNALKAADIVSAENDEALSSLAVGGIIEAFDLNGKIDAAIAAIPDGAIKDALGPVIGKLKDTLDKFINPNGIDYAFPFLSDPTAAVFKLLIGRDADLFTVDVKIQADGAFKQTYPTPIGIDIEFAGQGSVDLELHLGYDTFGIRQFVKEVLANGAPPAEAYLKFLDGVYMTTDTHFYLDGLLTAGAAINKGIASIAVEGGVSIGLHIDTPQPINGIAQVKNLDNDPNKIHLRPELIDCLFQTSGAVEASLDIVAKVGVGPLSVSKDFNLAHVLLLDLNGGCIPNPFSVPTELHLASTNSEDASIPAGTLRLNIGGWASERGISESEIDENYQVFSGAEPGTVIVLAFGQLQAFSGITHITGDGANGNDTITFLSASEDMPFSANVSIIGGDGKDRLSYTGAGNALLVGGIGDDQLTYEGSGNAVLLGDDGIDRLTFTGSGNGLLIGGAGNDGIKGGAGINRINGGDGDDHLTGGAGTNIMGVFTFASVNYTEDGDDTLIGGTGLNLLNGGAGNDSLFAGITSGDFLIGGIGNDQFVASAGSSSFQGDAGDDTFIWREGNGKPNLLDGGNERLEINTLEMTGGNLSDWFTLSKNPIDSQMIVGVQNASQNYTFLAHAIHNVLLEGGAGADTLIVNPLFGTPTQNVGLNLSDVLKNAQQVGDGVTDIITVNGRILADTAQIEAEQVAVQFIEHGDIIGGIMKVSGLPLYTVRLANVNDDFTYNAGAGNDVTTLLSNTGPTRLLGGVGDDIFNIVAAKLGDPASPANPANPKDYLAAVNVDAGAGKNAITFDESASFIGDTMLLGQSQFSSLLVPAVNFIATGGTYKNGVTVKGGQFADSISVVGSLVGVITSITAGAGDDTIQLGTAGSGLIGNLDSILGPVSANGEAGVNKLQLVDFGDANGNAAASITATQILKLAGPSDTIPLNYSATGGNIAITIRGSNSGVDNITLNSPSSRVTIFGNGGKDIVKANAVTAGLTFSGGTDDDQLILGATAHLLDGFVLPVTFQGDSGNDALLLDDTANPAARNFGIHAASITFAGIGLVNYDTTLESANIRAGKFADTFNVTATPTISGFVNIDGNLGDNSITGPNAANVWAVTALNVGTLNANVKFTRMPNLIGGTGSDRLDYSAYSTGVTINLTTGKTTNISGSIAAIENATGGLGADIIVGNAVANIITGGGGRDVLIGGFGADTIIGGADEDILIGGSTDFDAQALPLAAILKEWRTAGTYLTRIAHLTVGGGANGATFLTGATVHDDMVGDTITGGADAKDWFFARLIPGGMDTTDFLPTQERNG